MSPTSYFFLFEKAKKIIWNLFTVVVKKHFRQTFCPASRSRCIFKNSDSCRHKVCDFMRSHAIACERMRSHAIACDLMRSHAISCDRMRSLSNSILPEKGIIRDRMKSQTLCRQLSEFLKMHREREAGQKVCLKCFFTTTVNRFHYYFFRLSQKGRNEKRESFYTAKRVSSVHSCRDETHLAVFSVPLCKVLIPNLKFSFKRSVS